MSDRRNFIKALTVGAFGDLAAACQKQSNAPNKQALPAKLERVGLGLFTVPKLLDQDFAGTLKLIGDIGYKEVEFFGPYPFSVPAAHERWKAISATLELKQSGYFGLTPKQVKEILSRHGLSSPSMHTDLNTLRTRMNEAADAAHTLGQQYVTLPSIPADERKNLDGYKRIADEFNVIGASAEKAGVRFAYHNHGYGLTEMEGAIPFRVLLERTDPKLVALQMDIYWMTAGGADPIAYLKEYPGRFHSLHIKDMAKRVRFSGDGSDSKQWIELFPFISDAGNGVLDLPGILSAAKRSGAKHFLVERDLAPNAHEMLRNSYRYLAALQLSG